MIKIPSDIKIYLAIKPIHMNKSFDGLNALVVDVIEQNPVNGHLFVFHNRRGDKIKVFTWDRNGFGLWYKRLDRGRYKFPRTDSSSVTISSDDLKLLLDGIDLNKLKRLPELYYEAVL